MKFLIALIFSFPTLASVPELFGPSASTIAVGGQAQSESAANNYYASALLGYSQKTQFSFNTFYINTDFKSINNVIVKNESNSVSSYESGDVEVNNSPSAMFSAHLSVPVFSPQGPKLNLSLFAPMDRLMEADTSLPYQPRYVMYNERLLRPLMLVSASQSFSDWSYSLGLISGFQTNGETYFITRTTSGNPSFARLNFNAKPSLGLTASVAKKTNQHTTYLSFQQEMSSKLVNRATGETEIASNSSFAFDFNLSSLLYYDPMILRLGHQIKTSNISWLFSIEYQDWSNFENSNMKVTKLGGSINGSSNFEELELQNIFIPKIGLEYVIFPRWTLKAGHFYRPSPVKTSGLKNAGNTIDTDKHVSSLGLAHNFSLFQMPLTLDVAYQSHFLKQMKIVKTPGMENGEISQEKIGSPGYTVGGMIHVLSMGLSWMY
jgi:hypothetical protein